MNQILFEMYIGVITNFQKEPDYGHQIPHYKVFSRICFSNAATGACSKNNIYINYPDEENNGGSSGSGNDDNNGNPAKENALITFSASVEGRNITRAMSPMGKGLQSWLCAYTANTSNNITGAPVAQGNYVTSSPRCTDRKSRI